MKLITYLMLVFVILRLNNASELTKNLFKSDKYHLTNKKALADPVPCTCGIFLSGQFKKGSLPTTEPVLMQIMDTHFLNNIIGQRQCANKCLEVVIKHLPKSGELICATLDRDCVKEKAFLFTKNYVDVWVNSNMSAGKDYCCKDSVPYKCPLH